jgi:hypothetical protein
MPIRPVNGRKINGAQWSALQQICRALFRTPTLPVKRLDGGLRETPMIPWVLFQDYVEHLQHPSTEADGRARLAIVDSVVITDASCFRLTATGEAFARAVLAPARSDGIRRQIHVTKWLAPRFDFTSRTLYWGAHVIKVFRQSAKNQELLLRAAEELRWQEWMDDPLGRLNAGDPHERLHATLQNLNRHQRRRFIHFVGDGTGTRFGCRPR